MFIEIGNLSGFTGFTVTSAVPAGGVGARVTRAGDVNGDGFDDVLLAAPDIGDGQAFLIFGGSAIGPAQVDVGALSGVNGFTIIGDPGIYATQGLAAGEDLNGDGVDDIAIGAPNYSATGAVFVFPGSPGTGPASFTLGDAATIVFGETSPDLAGASVSLIRRLAMASLTESSTPW